MSVITLKGKVISGCGEGEFYVNLYARCFEAVLGFKPYPGTLNIILDYESIKLRKYVSKLINSIIIKPPNFKGLKLYNVKCYPATLVKGLNYEDVYIVEPEATRYGWEIIEVISKVNLRKKLGLRDGDEVKIEINVSRG